MNLRTVVSARSLVSLALTALTVGLCAPSAVAAPEREDLDAERLLTQQAITGSLVIDGKKSRLVNLEKLVQQVDEFGRAIGSPRTAALKASGESMPTLGEYACVHRGKTNKHFTAFAPAEIYQGGDWGKVQAQFHPYRQAEARKLGGGINKRSVQWELCGVGGADLADGRLRKIGMGITFPDAATTYKLGQAWRAGETPANFTTNLGFKVAHKKVPVEISGGITQTPTNKLLGSFSTPFPTPVDLYARNAVNAWWQDNCVGSKVGCRFWNGSKDFHGTVVQGLWEFSPAKDRTRAPFQVSAFLDKS